VIFLNYLLFQIPENKVGSQLKIGWVIGDQLDRKPWVREAVLTGGGVGLARYRWLADYVEKHEDLGVRYSVYRPWKHYDAVIFLKSMGALSLSLLQKLEQGGVPCIFDINVNYFEPSGKEYYSNMIPTEQQRHDVVAMAKSATAVIADSEFIAERSREYNPKTQWVPDNVPMDLLPEYQPTRTRKRLRLLWSGESVKLFELLAAEKSLIAVKDKVELVLVTNDLAALDRLSPDIRKRLDHLLSTLSVQVVRFQSIQHLFKIYSQGGVFISPRFLDSPYNNGHTEWKITLPMACGRVALCSPVPSYVKVADRAGGWGIRILNDAVAWEEALDEVLGDEFDWQKQEQAAHSVVDRYYSTREVASTHAAFVHDVVNENI
jgi:glycosyltransferase involved in cell wall biosynthesis